jgi:hypothetical protein
MTSAPPVADETIRRQRQVIYWRLLAAVFGMNKSAPNIESMTG